MKDSSEADWLKYASTNTQKLRTQFDSLSLSRDRSHEQAELLAKQLAAYLRVNEQVQQLALQTQQQCESVIANLVTRCLQEIFPENKYQFRLVFEQKRDQTEARCVLTDASGNEYDPITACGGGVVDVICFALRLATLILRIPQSSKILILDEPFRFLSKEHRGRLVNLLDALCTETGFQIIMVTHFPELSTNGNIIEL